MTTTKLVPVRRETRDVWDIAGELNDVFDSAVDVVPSVTVREGLWHPIMDIYDRANEIVVELELPGVDMKDVSLTVREGHLVVEGTRRLMGSDKESERFFSERPYGAFHRVVHLPTEVSTEKAEARFHEGLLVIRLPKVAREKGKTIEIRKQ